MILRWLVPLGFVGLSGVVVLLAIYLVKPQYKVKTVASTYVWKRVLLNGKKQFPTLNHILIFLLQAAALVLVAFCLARPFLFSKEALLKDSERVLIIDASASMLAKPADGAEEKSRFEKAVDAAVNAVDELFDGSDGSVYVILADSNPHYIAAGLGKDRKNEIYSALRSAECTFGESDLEGALKLAEQRLYANPYAQIIMYSDVEFGDMGTAFTYFNFADQRLEWNAAVLGCEVAWRDNEYVFNIAVGAYGNLSLKCDMNVLIAGATNAGGDPENYSLTVPVTFEVNSGSAEYESVQTVAVRATDKKYGGAEDSYFDSFDEVKISLAGLNDSCPHDDEFLVYGGTRDVINIEYWSAGPNEFWKDGFLNLSNNMRDKRLIGFEEIYEEYGMPVKNSGYDIYLFEHAVPGKLLADGMPQDGIVILSDPDSSILRLGIGVTSMSRVSLDGETGCTAQTGHALMNYINPANIRLTQYTKMEMAQDSLFLPIMFCNGDPVAFVKNTAASKIVVLPFSINMSDFYTREFQIFLYNAVNYFMPVTIEDFDYSVGETAHFVCKGESVEILHENSGVGTFESFPAEYSFSQTGTYVFKTKFGLAKPDEIRKVYVHVPPSESSLFKTSKFRLLLNNGELTGEVGYDVFAYLAAAALVLMLAEWYADFKYAV